MRLKLTMGNKKDKKNLKILLQCDKDISLLRRFNKPNDEKEDLCVANLLSKNQSEPMVNEFTIADLVAKT